MTMDNDFLKGICMRLN